MRGGHSTYGMNSSVDGSVRATFDPDDGDAAQNPCHSPVHLGGVRDDGFRLECVQNDGRQKIVDYWYTGNGISRSRSQAIHAVVSAAQRNSRTNRLGALEFGARFQFDRNSYCVRWNGYDMEPVACGTVALLVDVPGQMDASVSHVFDAGADSNRVGGDSNRLPDSAVENIDETLTRQCRLCDSSITDDELSHGGGILRRSCYREARRIWGFQEVPDAHRIAAMCLRRACEQGSAASCADLCWEFTAHANAASITSVDDCRRACQLSNYQCEDIGRLELRGLHGVAHDVQLGRIHIQLACEAGQGRACQTLVEESLSGQVLPRDLESARRWCDAAVRANRRDCRGMLSSVH